MRPTFASRYRTSAAADRTPARVRCSVANTPRGTSSPNAARDGNTRCTTCFSDTLNFPTSYCWPIQTVCVAARAGLRAGNLTDAAADDPIQEVSLPVTLRTSLSYLTAVSSHFNIAHFLNPDFQPEEWRPDDEYVTTTNTSKNLRHNTG